MMTSIVLKRATSDDLTSLRDISISTFQQAFAMDNTEENMKGYLGTSFSNEQLAHELASPHSEFYLAKTSHDVIGYLKINIELPEAYSTHHTIEIERIYVDHAYHGKGIAQLLMDKAFQRAKDIEAHQIWLGVWEKNPRAIAFYRKYGFADYDKHIFKLGDDLQTDILMKCKV